MMLVLIYHTEQAIKVTMYLAQIWQIPWLDQLSWRFCGFIPFLQPNARRLP